MLSKIDPYKSNEERLFALLGKPVIEALDEFKGGRVVEMTYEAVTLNCGGIKYTPDFYLKIQVGDFYYLALIETKGSKNQRGYQTSKTRLNTACGLYPEFVFAEFFINPRLSQITSWDIITKPPFWRFRPFDTIKKG